IRLICATNVGLDILSDETKFRKDLIYRINTVEIHVPPLRDRENDILLLAKYYLSLYAEKYFKSEFKLDESFIKKLKNYYFPGNVRELQYALERAVIMADTSILTDKDLVFSPLENQSFSAATDDVNLDDVEKNTIQKVINKNNGNISKSAKELGITRTALYRRMHKHGL
ncbi:MAG: helix-turn-helix domain-containing protein, partial [Flavobacteriales bacterium]